jgi:two-component system, chemotaxis family, CheB/CheR fusion protein
MTATDIGTLFLDTALHIQRFTPRITELFNIVAGDEGRPVTDFTHRLAYEDLVVDCRRVLSDLIPIERTIHTTNGMWFLLRLRPYRTLEDKIDGVVATFFNVTERHKADATWAEAQKLLLDELSHRVKNTLAVVQAVAHETLRGNGIDVATADVLDARLQALAAAHDLLVHGDWRGASLDALARQQLAPYAQRERMHLSGPSVILPAGLATLFGLILHELATNAVKHGSLRSPKGRVQLTWETRDPPSGERLLEMRWTERDGPPIKKPEKLGSGSSLIERGLLDGQITRRSDPEGLVCTIRVPLVGKAANGNGKEAGLAR